MANDAVGAQFGQRRVKDDAGAAAPAADPVRLLSLFEQGLISGANFFALLVLARGFSTENFGLYSFAYISLQFLVNLHRAVVIVPFVIHTAQADSLSREGRRWRDLNTAVAVASMIGVAAAARRSTMFSRAWALLRACTR